MQIAATEKLFSIATSGSGLMIFFWNSYGWVWFIKARCPHLDYFAGILLACSPGLPPNTLKLCRLYYTD